MDMAWSPIAPGKGQASADSFVVGGSDGSLSLPGKFYICSKSGKVEKSVEAHLGSILCVRWNYEASALVTGGEDGQIKIWSKNGMLRSTLAKTNFPIYCVVWAPNNESCLYTNGKNLVVKSLQPGNKPSQWKAHEGLVLKCDWNLVNNLIVSCGEDQKYKVWDSYGRKLFSSAPFEHSITSVSWSPNGEMFAFGTFNVIGVCDKLGWCNTMESPDCGSIFDISWTPDGTELACATGSGSVLFVNLINRRYGWKQYHVAILDDHKVHVYDVTQESTETMEFRDRIIKANIAYGYLVLTTAFQCYIYNEKNWNTPAIVDLSNYGRVTCIQQCPECLVLVDNFVGIQIYTYDGRLVSQPKYPGLRGEFITPQTLSLSSDVLAIKDHNDEKNIYLFDIKTGKSIGEGPVKHSTDILEIAVNKAVSPAGRQLAFLDKNRDLFLMKLPKGQTQKLGHMVDTFAWNDENDTMIAIMDGKLVLFYYPHTIFVDEDIAPLARLEKEGYQYGKNAQFMSFFGTSATLRRADGALMSIPGISPFPGLLQNFAKKKNWESAIKLCRHVQQKELWAALAGMSLFVQDLNTAEVAYANIDEIHKVQYVCYIRDLPSQEARAAELALLRKQPREAETILLSSNLVYRCIRMWIDLFNWDRALELAVKHKSHIDTVLHYRAKYMRDLGREEDNKRFIQVSQSVTVDWNKVKAKIAIELESEKSLGVKSR